MVLFHHTDHHYYKRCGCDDCRAITWLRARNIPIITLNNSDTPEAQRDMEFAQRNPDRVRHIEVNGCPGCRHH